MFYGYLWFIVVLGIYLVWFGGLEPLALVSVGKNQSELGLIFGTDCRTGTRKFLIFEEPDQEPDSATRFPIPFTYGTRTEIFGKKTTRSRG